MKTLPIVWQRLVTREGRTCPRCQGTHEEVLRAMARLRAALAPLGVTPTLETRALDEQDFRGGPLESNRIWIAGRPMEDWLQGTAGSSRCCEVCGECSCRTLEVDGERYETIPESLIVRAALIAASRMRDPSVG